MPYLQFLFCEHCGPPNNLDIDSGATIDEYIKEGRASSFINPATVIWDYLIYSCPLCKSRNKYTYQDVEKIVRQYFSSLSAEYKDYFDTLSDTGDETANHKFRKINLESETRVRDRYTNNI